MKDFLIRILLTLTFIVGLLVYGCWFIIISIPMPIYIFFYWLFAGKFLESIKLIDKIVFWPMMLYETLYNKIKNI